jgi:hypothetical protein
VLFHLKTRLFLQDFKFVSKWTFIDRKKMMTTVAVHIVLMALIHGTVIPLNTSFITIKDEG